MSGSTQSKQKPQNYNKINDINAMENTDTKNPSEIAKVNMNSDSPTT